MCKRGGEIRRVFKQKVGPQHIVFAGVGKKLTGEIELAIDRDIFAFNCESLEEIEFISPNSIFKEKAYKHRVVV